MQNMLILMVQNGFILLFCVGFALFLALKKDQKPPSAFAQICFLALYLAPLMMIILQILNVFEGEIQDKYLLVTSFLSLVLSAILFQFGVTADNYFIFNTKKLLIKKNLKKGKTT